MKKWLIGCGITLFILIALCAGGVFFAAYKTSQVFSGFEKSAASVQVLNSKYPFAEPKDGAVDVDRLATYFEIREAVSTKLYANEAFVAMTQAFEGKQPKNVGFGDMMGLVFNFSREMIEFFAKQLEQHKMSPEEYMFLAEGSYSVISAGNAKEHADMAEVYKDLSDATDAMNQEMKKQNKPDVVVDFDAFMAKLDDPTTHPITPEMVDVVLKYKDQLVKYPHIAFIELLIIKNRQKFAGTPMNSPAKYKLGTPIQVGT